MTFRISEIGRWAGALALAGVLAACGGEQGGANNGAADARTGETAAVYDVIIRDGTVYDGSGKPGVEADIAIRGERIAAIGDLDGATADTEIDAADRAVTPGFINMLSWAIVSLIEDGRGLSDIKQGVTLEVFGEGWSMGPLTPASAETMQSMFGRDIEFDVEWNTLGGYLEWLAARGVSPNVASFAGATTLRINYMGFEDRPPTAYELVRMQADLALAMEEGAVGLGTSLIYPPAFYAGTDELTALAKVAGRYGGVYTSHMRSEGARLLEAVDELIAIARTTGIRANIYHLKAAGKKNWHKLDAVFEKVEAARAEGLKITADMYPYAAGATGLIATTPPWAQEGGLPAFIDRTKDPETRARIIEEMRTPTDEWEQLLSGSGGGEGIILLGFSSDELKPLTGKTLAEVAQMRGTSVEETVLDLIAEDGSRVGAAFFLMSEDNLPRKLARPWVSIGSDAEAAAPEGVFLESSTHPRAYGTFARVLAKYVREEGVLTLEEAVRRMTALPADNLGLTGRGRLKEGAYADIVVFDPGTIQDHATFTEPMQFATGVDHVFINGTQVLKDGEHTGATPGQVVRGRGYAGPAETVILETEEGEIELRLYPQKTPVAVSNFLKYVDGGHFDGASFYRVAREDNQTRPGKIEVVQGGLL
ncbi:MAG: amidohydrolase family protein, partial [Alphaproteobacteria bacterium]